MQFYVALCDREKMRITLEPTEDAGLVKKKKQNKTKQKRSEICFPFFRSPLIICLTFRSKRATPTTAS